MRYFIDTNIFLDFFVREDEEKHADCEKLIGKINNGEAKAVTSGLVLAELAWVLKGVYKIEKTEIIKVLRRVVSLRGLRIYDKTSWLGALGVYETKKVKLVDAVITSIMPVATGKWAVVSYDKDFDKLGVKRMEPGDLLGN